MRTGRHILGLAAFWLFCLTLALSQTDEGGLPLVDFRMTPIEQARKLHAMNPDLGASTMTVMNLVLEPNRAEYDHLIVTAETVTPASVQRNLGLFHSVSWTDYQTNGACDSQASCQTKVNGMCDAAGKGGVDAATVAITVHADGTKSCAGKCKSGNAVAMVTCGNGKP